VSTPPKAYCPICNENGKRVDVITLKAMLDISLLVLQNGPYFYCRTADCPVVYFAADGLQSFSKAQIRVRVYQKEPADGSVLVCYCFRHSPNSIRDEFKTTGQRKVIEEIKEAVEAGKCACEICNPQGSCCLGNVSAVVKQLTTTLKMDLLSGHQSASNSSPNRLDP
jgi:hypothetical protein